MGFPQKNKKVITSSIYSENSHVINSPFYINKNYEYELAYMYAADKLIDETTNEYMKDSLYVLPALFLYRQFLELYIKDIARNYNIVNEKDSGKYYGSHDLQKLWKNLYKHIVAIDYDFPEVIDGTSFSEYLEATTDYLNEIANYDNGSMAFRYPNDKKNRAFFEEPVEIDVVNLKERVHELANMLAYIDETLSYRQTLTANMEEMMLNSF